MRIRQTFVNIREIVRRQRVVTIKLIDIVTGLHFGIRVLLKSIQKVIMIGLNMIVTIILTFRYFNASLAKIK